MKKLKLNSNDFFFANNRLYLAHYPERKEALIRAAKKFLPEECICCFFFKWDEDTPICSLLKDLEGFDYGKRASNCPLTRKD